MNAALSLPNLGRPSSLTDEYLRRLQELISVSPREYGYDRDRWTGFLLQQHLAQELNIEVSDRHINRLLQQMGLSARKRRTAPAQSFQEQSLDPLPQQNVRISDCHFSPDLLMTAVETVTDAVEITDCHANYLYVNPAFEAITGYTRAEVIGQTPAALLRSGLHGESFYKEMFDAVLHGQSWHGCMIGKQKYGALLEFKLHLSPILAPTGALTHIVAVKRLLKTIAPGNR
jgi:PAS domain S-box-containing protein